MDVGENVVVARCGSPLTERFTVPEKTGAAAIVTVYVAVPPRVIVMLAGVAEIEKSPLTTTSVTFTEWLTGPLAPRIVSG